MPAWPRETPEKRRKSVAGGRGESGELRGHTREEQKRARQATLSGISPSLQPIATARCHSAARRVHLDDVDGILEDVEHVKEYEHVDKGVQEEPEEGRQSVLGRKLSQKAHRVQHRVDQVEPLVPGAGTPGVRTGVRTGD